MKKTFNLSGLLMAAGLVLGISQSQVFARLTGTDPGSDVWCGGVSGAEVCVNAAGDVIPTTTNDADLGTSSFLWNELHLTAGGLTDSAIATGDLADSAVTTPKVSAAAITSAKILDAAVTTDKLGTGAVTTAKIADDSVIAIKLLNEAVTTAKIGAGGVTTPKIADDSVIAIKLLNGAVTTAKIGTDAVTPGKISLEDGGFLYGQALCVTSGKKIGVCFVGSTSSTLCDCR